MPFCGKCDSKVNDEDRFCARCGTSRKVSTEKNNEGVKSKSPISNCPNCGAIVDNFFQTNCSYCGYKFVKDNYGSTVADFAERLNEVDAQIKAANTNNSKSIYTLDFESSTSKANLISNFVIPNNLEDILEFMILSSSNIIPSYIAGTVYVDQFMLQNMLNVQNAWISKMEQAYNKAKLSFGSEPLFNEVERLYNDKKQAIEKEKKKRKKRYVILAALVVIFIILLVIFPFVVA